MEIPSNKERHKSASNFRRDISFTKSVTSSQLRFPNMLGSKVLCKKREMSTKSTCFFFFFFLLLLFLLLLFLLLLLLLVVVVVVVVGS